MRIQLKELKWGRPEDLDKYEKRWFEYKRFLLWPKVIDGELRWLEQGHWFAYKWWGDNLAHTNNERWIEEMLSIALTSELEELGLDK